MPNLLVEVDLEILIVTPCCKQTIGTSELGMNHDIQHGEHILDCPKCKKKFTLIINEPF